MFSPTKGCTFGGSQSEEIGLILPVEILFQDMLIGSTFYSDGFKLKK